MISTAKRIGLHVAVWGGLALTILAIVLWIYFGLSVLSIVLFVSFLLISQLGVSIGFHRLFTHRSFEAVWPIKALLAVFGSMSLEGDLYTWVATHRKHHQFTDVEGDPHSPLHGKAHSHAGWLWKEPPPDSKRIQDLLKDPTLRFINRYFVLWTLISILLPPLIAFCLTGSFVEMFYGFLWGTVVRICVVHHITWSINSICHIWGQRPYDTGDESRNNFIFAILAFGEGNHNNHHAFQRSARHGFRWYEPDISWWIIRFLEILHLASNVKKPSAEDIETKRKNKKIE